MTHYWGIEREEKKESPASKENRTHDLKSFSPQACSATAAYLLYKITPTFEPLWDHPKWLKSQGDFMQHLWPLFFFFSAFQRRLLIGGLRLNAEAGQPVWRHQGCVQVNPRDHQKEMSNCFYPGSLLGLVGCTWCKVHGINLSFF